MHGLEKHVALWLVFLAGLGAAIYGVYLLLGLRHVELAAAQVGGGLALVAWVIFHPARVPEDAPADV
jgi:hypothetical protein